MAVDTAAGYPDTGENGQTYEAEFSKAERIRVGNTVTVTKKEDPYIGKTGRIVNVTTLGKSSKAVCQVDLGTSTTREYLESELARVPRPTGMMGARLSCERCGSTLFFVEATFWDMDPEKRHNVEPDLICANCSHTISLDRSLYLLKNQVEEKTRIGEQVTLDGIRRQVGETA